MRPQYSLVVVAGLCLAGCAADQMRQDAALVTYTEEREMCADRSATRNAYFGDLHIHFRSHRMAGRQEVYPLRNYKHPSA